MSIINSYDNCPQCKCAMSLISSFETETGIVSEYCRHCGHKSWEIRIKNADGSLKFTIDGKYIFRRYERPGYGTWEVLHKEFSGVYIGRFDAATAEEKLESLLEIEKVTDFEILFASIIRNGKLEIIVNKREISSWVCPSCKASTGLEPTDTSGWDYECQTCGHEWSIYDDNLRK